MPDPIHVSVFFGFASFIIVYAFTMIYRKGWIITIGRAIEGFPELMVGLALLFFGTGVLLLNIAYFMDILYYESLVCLTAPTILYISGFYIVSSIAKNQPQ